MDPKAQLQLLQLTAALGALFILAICMVRASALSRNACRVIVRKQTDR
jgi:hypothetical protein